MYDDILDFERHSDPISIHLKPKFLAGHRDTWVDYLINVINSDVLPSSPIQIDATIQVGKWLVIHQSVILIAQTPPNLMVKSAIL